MLLVYISSVFMSLIGPASALSIHDPRLSPGHLQPLGAGRPKNPVDSALQYPNPADFFTKYVDKKIPFVIRGAAKSSSAYTKWNDAYFRKTPDIASMRVSVDRDKKELHNISDYRHMKFERFLDRFRNEELFLVDGIKTPLQHDVLLPAPLRCKETRKQLQDTALWFSSGGTKSVLSVTYRDEIVCVIRGANEYLMLPFMKYKKRFQKIKAEADLREVDVDRVDFGKYPELEDVEWLSAYVNEGDCIYIPYKWANQVNSFGGKTKESIFITFSFNHIHDHRPKDCNIEPSQATLDKFQFTNLELEQMDEKDAELALKHNHGNETNGSDDEDHYHDGLERVSSAEERGLYYFKIYRSYLKKKQSKTLNFKQFVEIIKKDDKLVTTSISDYNLPESFDKLAREIFDMLDFNHDSLLSGSDFKSLKKSKIYQDILADLEWRTHGLESYVDDYIESSHHGMSDEEFDVNRKARELRKKLSIHDPMEL